MQGPNNNLRLMMWLALAAFVLLVVASGAL